MTGSPLVSVIIPHFNRSERVARTLDTVLQQTVNDWEVLIVDDCSPTDPEAQLATYLRDPRIKLLRLDQNGGPSRARNTGIAQASAPFLAFLDSDDMWMATKLERQLALIEESEDDKVIVTTQIAKRTGDVVSLAPKRSVGPQETFAQYLILNGGTAQTSSIMLSRKAANDVRFDESLRQFEDYLFFIKAGANGLQHRLALEPLVIWDNDPRDDRLSWSRDRNMESAWRFLAASDGLIDERSRLMFLTNHVGSLLVRERPVAAAAIFMRALTSGLLTPRHAIKIIAHGLLPPPMEAALQSALKRKRG